MSIFTSKPRYRIKAISDFFGNHIGYEIQYRYWDIFEFDYKSIDNTLYTHRERAEYILNQYIEME